jgi:hypothetical protein
MRFSGQTNWQLTRLLLSPFLIHSIPSSLMPLIKFLEHCIGDKRVLRLIRKWLRPGIIEDCKWLKTKLGTPQGAVISPLLSNVYLHYVFDLWMKWWREKRCIGEVIVVRDADDFVIGFVRVDRPPKQRH